MTHEEYMKEAIKIAELGIRLGHGGPFGTVIVKDDKIIAREHNRVLVDNDPTAHGEITAIRKACKELGTFDLSGCTLYTTGEPCGMCLIACLWANIEHVYYGCTIEDNAVIGFRDEKFDQLINREPLKDYLTEVGRDECLELFNRYNNMEKTLY